MSENKYGEPAAIDRIVLCVNACAGLTDGEEMKRLKTWLRAWLGIDEGELKLKL